MNFNNKIIAHRGESFEAPENTLASINLAWEKGATSVEIDIRLTRDNEIVVIHDKNTKRTAQKWMYIKYSTLSKLKTLDVGLYKGLKWKNQRIPTLKEVLKTIPDYGKLILEIKSDKKILKKLQEELIHSGLNNNQIEIIAFNLKTLHRAKKLMPQYKMLWLLNLDYYLPKWLLKIDTKKIIQKTKESALDGINVWAGKALNENFISDIKNENLDIYVWTVNSPTKAKWLFENSIDGIATDKASWLKEELNKENLKK